MPGQTQITQLLEAVSNGDEKALNDLLPLVYDELRRIASAYVRREGHNLTLQTTALVHEAYLRLVGKEGLQLTTRLEFFGIAAHVMRRILVQRARARRAEKRGGTLVRHELDDTVASFEESAIDLLAQDEALGRLEAWDERKSQVVELRFFGGMSCADIAEFLQCPLRTVERDWTVAKTWLRAQVDPDKRKESPESENDTADNNLVTDDQEADDREPGDLESDDQEVAE